MRDYIEYLKLKRPVRLTLVNRTHKAADAEYEPEYRDSGKLDYHKITIYNNPHSRDFDSLVAHELIHAWQEENKKWETHGPYFTKLAYKMQKHFGLREIYLPGIDEE